MKCKIIFDAIKSTKPPPCEAFACANFNKCKTEELACYSFQRYVTGGAVWHPKVMPRGGKPEDVGPNKEIYDKLYNDEDDKLWEKELALKVK